MTQDLLSLQCSKCAATLNVPRDSRVLTCPYCQAEHLLDGAASSGGTPYDSNPTVYEGKALSDWLAELKDHDRTTRINALRALYNLGPKIATTDSVSAVIPLLDDDDVATQAVITLGQIGHPSAIPAILRRARTLDCTLFDADGPDPQALFFGKARGTEPGCLLIYCIRVLAKFGPNEESVAFLTDIARRAAKDRSIHNASLRALEALAPSSSAPTGSKGCASILVLGIALAAMLFSLSALR